MKNCIFPQNGQYNIGWQYNKPNRNKNRFQWNKYTNGSYTWLSTSGVPLTKGAITFLLKAVGIFLIYSVYINLSVIQFFSLSLSIVSFLMLCSKSQIFFFFSSRSASRTLCLTIDHTTFVVTLSMSVYEHRYLTEIVNIYNECRHEMEF